jgi:hypothetical protein
MFNSRKKPPNITLYSAAILGLVKVAHHFSGPPATIKYNIILSGFFLLATENSGTAEKSLKV